MSSVGILAPGAFADIVGFRADLLDCPVDDLPSQQPALTVVGGGGARPRWLVRCRMSGFAAEMRAGGEAPGGGCG